MIRWKIPRLIASASGLFALAYGHFAAARPQNDGPVACEFMAGEQLAFSVHSSTTQRAEGSAEKALDLDAVLWWRVQEDRAAAGWVVAAALAEVRTSPEPASPDLAAPFLLTVGRDCRFREIAFRPQTALRARRQITGLLRQVEVILSPQPNRSWISHHKDELGTFNASYQRDGASLQRTHTSYASTVAPSFGPQFGGALRVDVLGSTITARLDSQGRWVRELSARAQLRVSLGAQLLSEVDGSVQLSRREPAGEVPAALYLARAEQFTAQAVARTEGDRDPVPPPEPDLAAMDLDGALADFGQNMKQGVKGLHAASRRLAGYLAQHPEALAGLLAKLRSGGIDPALHAPLFLALERTGTPQAEAALTTALGDRGLATIDRQRAAAALPDIAHPSASTARVLIAQAQQGGAGEDEQQVAASALLALGVLSHHTLAGQPELAQVTREALSDRLHAARGPADVGVALTAIGNSGDPALADLVRPYSSDNDPLVRAHAAAAYRRMDGAEPALASWLGGESESRVVRAIGNALAEKLHDDGRAAAPPTVAAAAARLAVEADPRARAALIQLLGTAAAADASAKQALIQQFHRETVSELLVLIGRYVGAAELG